MTCHDHAEAGSGAEVKAVSSGKNHPAGGSSVFWRELQRDVLLWLVSFGLLGGFRLFMIWFFGGQMEAGHGAGDIVRAALRGARVDSMVATYPVLPSLALTLACLFVDVSAAARRVRGTVAVAAVAAHLAICGVTVGYFREYHDQFNQWVIGLVTDDRLAIARTIWRGYPILLYLSGYLAATMLGGWAVIRLLRWFPPWHGPRFPIRTVLSRAITAILAVGVFFLAIRGWGIRRPVKQRDLAATRDVFLNKIVANPYVALRYAILDYRYVTSAKGLSVYLGDRAIAEAAKSTFPHATSWRDLDALCKRVASGRKGSKPRHIFLIVGESLDAWPLLPEYQALGLANGLMQLAVKGVSCKAFVSAGFETIHAIGTLVGGLPEAGVNLNYQPSSQKTFATASAPIFKRLGYRTRFVYAGYSWQRVDEFCLAQGFDEYIGLPNFKNLPSGAVGTWGAFDEHVFNHVLHEIPADKPGFNLILTTVNHPPYDCDVYAHGFPHRTMPASFDRLYDRTDPMKVFGHQWYTAKCIGDFIALAEKRFPEALFIVTGDHASRHFLNSHPSLFERTAVPCILYGPGTLKGVGTPPATAGSHLDLIPTLVELCADTGFEYTAMGRNLFDREAEPLGLGGALIATPRFFYQTGYAQPCVVPGETLPQPMPSLEDLRWRHSSLLALSWWRAMKGNLLTPATDSTGND